MLFMVCFLHKVSDTQTARHKLFHVAWRHPKLCYSQWQEEKVEQVCPFSLLVGTRLLSEYEIFYKSSTCKKYLWEKTKVKVN